MVVSGVIMIPNTAKAAQQINKENGIIYKEMNMSTYWNEQTKTAPVEPGCVFAGEFWFSKDEYCIKYVGDDNRVEWIKYLLEDIETNNTQKIADLVLNEAIDNNYGVPKDDMSIIVCKIIKNS